MKYMLNHNQVRLNVKNIDINFRFSQTLELLKKDFSTTQSQLETYAWVCTHSKHKLIYDNLINQCSFLINSILLKDVNCTCSWREGLSTCKLIKQKAQGFKLKGKYFKTMFYDIAFGSIF